MQNGPAPQTKTNFSRFKLFCGEANEDGAIQRTKTVGMAYQKEGDQQVTLRLWTFVNERFYMIPSRTNPEEYLIMTREENRSPNAKNKYFWNIVGNARVLSMQGIMKIEFDLLPMIFMPLQPETSPSSSSMASPEFSKGAA